MRSDALRTGKADCLTKPAGPAISIAGVRKKTAGMRDFCGLPAGQRHWPRHLRPLAPADDEIMAFGLAGDGLVDGGVEQGVVPAGPERRPEVGCVLLAETHIERAGAGDAHAIAGLAEIVGHRRDEAEPAAGLAHVDITRRAARAVRIVVEGEVLLEPRPQQRQRQILLHAVGADLAHGHGLDQGQVEAMAMRPADDVLDLVLVHVAQRHGVDLDLEAGAVGRVDAAHALGRGRLCG